MRLFFKYSFAGLAAVLAGLMLAAQFAFTLPSEMKTPSGHTRNESLYVTMHDGVKIAIDIWFPADLQAGQKVPSVIRGTRYVRTWKPTMAARAIAMLGLVNPNARPAGPEPFNRAGFAYVIADARGTGASYGQVSIPVGPEEIADYHEVIEWIARQNWSNSKVGAVGISYDGMTAESMADGAPPALKAVAPLYHNFDTHFYLVTAGGVYNQGFTDAWAQRTAQMDRNELPCKGLQCAALWALISGIKCVDEDRDCALRDEAVHLRKVATPDLAARGSPFRDDLWDGMGHTLSDVSSVGRRAAEEKSGLPMFVVAGWLDSATVDGAISRYRTFSNPQQVLITGASHGGMHGADPFTDTKTPPDPTVAEFNAALIQFFRTHLGDTPAPAPVREIKYYTFGASRWNTTQTWPPAGFESNTSLYLAPDHSLSGLAPAEGTAADRYAVDYTVGTGATSRWATSIGGPDVIYTDRAEADRKLLSYTGEPLTQDMELTGYPVLSLFLTSTADDAALHVYLEDVAPDGRVTYLTEGVFRAAHRKLDETPLYVTTGPQHSFLRKDAMPLVPGEVAEIAFALYPTSVVLKQNHRIRVAIAGADAPYFERYPASGPAPVFEVQRTAKHPSRIELPMRVLATNRVARADH